MKAELKQKEGKKWIHVNLSEIIGQSIVNFMRTSDKRLMAALLGEHDKPVLFLANNDEDVVTYKEKGLSMHVDDLFILLGDNPIPDVVLQVFPDAKFQGFTVKKPDEEWETW